MKIWCIIFQFPIRCNYQGVVFTRHIHLKSCTKIIHSRRMHHMIYFFLFTIRRTYYLLECWSHEDMNYRWQGFSLFHTMASSISTHSLPRSAVVKTPNRIWRSRNHIRQSYTTAVRQVEGITIQPPPWREWVHMVKSLFLLVVDYLVTSMLWIMIAFQRCICGTKACFHRV